MFKTIETQEQYDELSQLTMSEVGLKKDMTELQKMLLDYRRKNKIYEVGDYVVRGSKKTKPYLWKVIGFSNIWDDNLVCCVDEELLHHLSIYEVRHATDEEIKLGRRTKLGKCI